MERYINMGDNLENVQITQGEIGTYNEVNQGTNDYQDGGYQLDMGDEERQHSKMVEFNNCRQDTTELVDEFAARLQKALMGAYPYILQDEKDRMLLECFICKLKPSLRTVVTIAYVNTMDEALAIARRIEVQPIPDTQDTVAVIRDNIPTILATVTEGQYTATLIVMTPSDGVPPIITTVETEKFQGVEARIQELEQQPVEAKRWKVTGGGQRRWHNSGKAGHKRGCR